MTDKNRSKKCTGGLVAALGGIFGLLAVALGAFGAHALKARLVEADMLAVWKTAVDYQMWHALALVAIGLRADAEASPLLSTAAGCFTAGVILFSGSLYWLALEGPRWLGPITPLGGLLLIVGWAILSAFAIKRAVKG